MKKTNAKKLAIAGVFCAVAVVGSLFSFPVFGSKCSPVQHMVNILCSVLLGPGYSLGAAFAAALIPAAITVGAIKAKYQLKFEDFHYDAYTDSDVQLSVKSDRLVNKFVTHRRIPKNSGSSGGSSGGGGSRSSVHTSSSGRSHGGGGRKF